MATFLSARDKFFLTKAATEIHDAAALVGCDLGDRLDLTIYISCYNEREYILDTMNSVCAALDRLNLAYELVVIDDASTDGSAALVEGYVDEHPGIRIVFRRNTLNKGWAQNYVDGAFIGRGKYYGTICGDNSLTVAAIHEMYKPMGQADIIVPYYVDAKGKDRFRRSVSSIYTVLVNTISGNRLHYYNGLAIHRRYNVMRWHTNTRGFGFQADILCMLLAQGASYIEVPTSTVEKRQGASNALTWRNMLSVAHTLIDIFLRRISNRVHGRIENRLEVESQRPPTLQKSEN
jgi:glycosyltransferase involved in cell wall biosynthesis